MSLRVTAGPRDVGLSVKRLRGEPVMTPVNVTSFTPVNLSKLR